MRLLLLSVFVILFFAQANTQIPIMQASAKAYAVALDATRLQKNKNHLLPIKNIQSKIAYLKLDGKTIRPILEKYTNIHTLSSVNEPISSYDILIVQADSLTPIVDQQLQSFQKTTDIQKILITSEKQWQSYSAYFHAVLTITNHNELANSIAAQFIMGGIDYLPNMLQPQQGLNQPPFRLGYTPPELVGVDRSILEDSIRAIIEYGIAQGAFPGAQVLVAKQGKIIYHKAFGYPTFNHRRLVRVNDIYDMASVSKVTTVLPAVMKLVGENKFRLDEPLKNLWPKFKRTNKANLTWRSVLAHNARLQPWIPYWKNTLRKHPKKNGWRFKWCTFKDHQSRRYPIHITDHLWLHRKYKKKIFKAIAKTPLNKEPGYKYSGLAFYILPTIVEHITGDKFEHYLKTKIYQPLGANTLTYNPLRFYPKERIIPTERDTFFRMEQIQGTVHDEGAIMMGGVSGNAGLFGTANDMAKLWQMYLNKGLYGGYQIIQPQVLEEFTKCQYCPEGNHRGLGFDKPHIQYEAAKASYAKDASQATFGHAGYTGTLIWADPANDLLFIFLSNRVYPTRNNRKLYTLNIRPRLHNAIYQSIIK